MFEPSFTDAGALKVAVGATFTTVRLNVVVTMWPLPSFAVIVTVCDCAGPSVVPNDQLQVPLFVPVLVTVPTEAVIATLSPLSGSEYVPVFVAVAPSFTVRDALSAATVGALFEFTKCAYASVMFPLLPPVSVEMQGVGVPGMFVPESVELVPLVHL